MYGMKELSIMIVMCPSLACKKRIHVHLYKRKTVYNNMVLRFV